jgi:hypothetical protein
MPRVERDACRAVAEGVDIFEPDLTDLDRAAPALRDAGAIPVKRNKGNMARERNGKVDLEYY